MTQPTATQPTATPPTATQPTARTRLMARPHRLIAPALIAAMACAGLLVGCMPTGDGVTDGVITEGVGEAAPAGLVVEFLWPDGAVITDDGVQFSEPTPLALRVRLTNDGRVPLAVRLDDLTMRPVADPEDPAGEGFVEAVYRSPGALRLEPGATRDLDFGEVRLFFGFACTVHLTGAVEIGGAAGARTVALARDSRPILLDL